MSQSCAMQMRLEMSLAGEWTGETDAAPDGWRVAGPVDAFPVDGGACVKLGPLQVAVFNFARRGQWFACQNLCPHRREMALSRGLLGSTGSVAKVACPHHKTTFSLDTGACLSADFEAIQVYPVRVENGRVFVRLP